MDPDPIAYPSSTGLKRPCPGGDDLASSGLFAGGGTASSTSTAVDRLLGALLALPDPFLALELSLERLVDASPQEVDRNRTVDAAARAASALLEAARRSARKLASRHNTVSWPLPSDLTIKVFSMLDTQCLCHAAATCMMFNKCALDPLCYVNIDLTTVVPKINNTVVSTMIQRAGKNLLSLKLGIRSTASSNMEVSRPLPYSSRVSMDPVCLSWNDKRSRQGRESALTRSCLLALSSDGGAAGALLRRLHLYNIHKMDGSALCTALAACQSLLDLEVIGLHIELKRTLDAVSTNCHSIQRLFFESSETGRDDSLKSPTCIGLANGCRNLSSFALRGFKVNDHKIQLLIKGLRYLKYLDFSTSYSITGTFLRNLGGEINAQFLEVLILRDCLHLKEVEVTRFLSAVLAGECKHLRHLDISNKDGLSTEEDWNNRCYRPSIPTARFSEERPEICLIAKFPPESSFTDTEHFSDGEISSNNSLPVVSAPIYPNLYTSSSEFSYGSDQGSGSEDLHDANFGFYDWDTL